jgi:hypothetical protein
VEDRERACVGVATATRQTRVPGVGAALLITTVHAWYRRRRLRLWCSCTCRRAPRILYVFQRRRGGALLALTHESCKKKLAEEAIDPVAATECWSWMDGQLGEPRPYCSRTSGCQRERERIRSGKGRRRSFFVASDDQKSLHRACCPNATPLGSFIALALHCHHYTVEHGAEHAVVAAQHRHRPASSPSPLALYTRVNSRRPLRRPARPAACVQVLLLPGGLRRAANQ